MPLYFSLFCGELFDLYAELFGSLRFIIIKHFTMHSSIYIWCAVAAVAALAILARLSHTLIHNRRRPHAGRLVTFATEREMLFMPGDTTTPHASPSDYNSDEP